MTIKENLGYGIFIDRSEPTITNTIPKIAPIFNEILGSKSFGGIKNANHDIINAIKDPTNNFINRYDPDLSIVIL